ncbi:putative acyl-activating enzyme 1, peroxisomal [Vitis vinifera]|uniref:Putative acyl-activating enzyme 1, peroxisomal n=1 Tax=Vitis vinifera TaxID=29760 RepID=A0A438ET70_VITVI|nr:putative acyl-activating enzyme 1, peroxisomal [Vitis vinifera]
MGGASLGVWQPRGHQCLPKKCDRKGIFDSISQHRVTHMGGAPTVLNMIINAPVGDQRPLPGKVAVMTGETYGPGTVCTWKPEWDLLPPDKQAKINARQGLHHLGMEEVDIKDPVTMKSVPPDAKTIGEVMFRGNTVMNGYLKDIKATEESFKGGGFVVGTWG